MTINESPPIYTNPLINSASLYLRQHAHNPVMWYPWGEEAIGLAKQQDKPILLSIGYSSCYWCHVMEREVFEDVSIASLMNQHFINIKLDREEHPLVDETYMVARQLLTREGGWPNNVFLTPELKPFYACGTHLAKDSGDRPSFPRLLEWLRLQWENERGDMEKQGAEIYRLTGNLLARGQRKTNTAELPLASLLHTLTDQLIGRHDDMAGGFGKQPKFPQENYLAFLLHVGDVLKYQPAIDVAAHSLLHMAAGGIFDQVGCGFHRYAVDKHWRVPHFEKMLYNQAMCASVYIKAAALTNSGYFSDIAKGTLEFVSGPMRSEHGAFFAAIDAETDGVEGAYYAWRAEEIEALLTAEEWEFFNRYYALATIPHFPGHKAPTGHALVLDKPLWQAARDDGLPYVQLATLAGQVMNKLLAARNQRQSPALDDKVITSWNGLIMKAFAEGAYHFSDDKFKTCAVEAAAFFRARHQENKRLHHTYYGTTPGTEASLEDYAYLAQACLRIHTLCEDVAGDWLGFAKELLAQARTLFFDEASGSYRLNPQNNLTGITLSDATDAVLPSAVGVVLECYVALHKISGDAEHLAHAQQLRDSYQPHVKPQSIPENCQLLSALFTLALEGKDREFIEATHALFADTGEAARVVKLTAHLEAGTEVLANQAIAMHIQVELQEGWHIDAFGGPGSTSKLTISGPNIAAIESIVFPEATALEMADGGKKMTLAGTFTIPTTLLCSDQKNRQPIDVTMFFQPCNQAQCYGPQRVVYKV